MHYCVSDSSGKHAEGFVRWLRGGFGADSTACRDTPTASKLYKCHLMLLQTMVDNYTAQKVYENNGWKRVDDFIFYEVKC